jgi:hypothetical protein
LDHENYLLKRNELLARFHLRRMKELEFFGYHASSIENPKSQTKNSEE